LFSFLKSRIPAWLTRNVAALGMVALFTDMATDMAMPLLPAFMASLGAGAMALGLVEGASDFTAAILKFYSGRASDLSGRRRPWVLGGYFLSSLVRPFLALATQSWHVLLVRVSDRTGKGLRTSPRDAMLADSVKFRFHGAAFGFHQALDHLGAVIGPLLAMALLLWGGLSVRSIFWLTAVPGAIAVGIIVFGVVEVTAKEKAKTPKLGKVPGGLAAFLIPVGLFSLGASSDLFLLKKAGAEDMPLWGMPLLWVGLHVVKSASSLWGGRLSDRFGPRRIISLGWIFYALVYALFAVAKTPSQIIGLFLAYGIFYGLTEAPEKAMVAKIAGPKNRGAAFGWYHLTTGLLSLPASLVFGLIWDSFGAAAAFFSGAAFAMLGLAALWLPQLQIKKGAS
jgi:MFS family permease